MALNIYNQSSYRGYLKYKKDFVAILDKTKSVLGLKGRLAVSVILVDDKEIQEINRSYRNIDRPTDVISFALADEQSEFDYFAEELGDIFINLDAVKRQAEDYGHSERREICFLFTHGLLHLNGFDHQNKKDEERMIHYQKVILDDLVSRND